MLMTKVDRGLTEQGKLERPNRAILDPLSMQYHIMAVLNDGGGDGFPNCDEGRLLMLDREVRKPGSTPNLHIEIDGCIGSGKTTSLLVLSRVCQSEGIRSFVQFEDVEAWADPKSHINLVRSTLVQCYHLPFVISSGSCRSGRGCTRSTCRAPPSQH